MVEWFLYVVECLGQQVTKVDAAHDEAGFVDVALAVPSEIDECAGDERAEDIKHWCHDVF